MKKLVASVAFLAALSTSAFAADMVVKARPVMIDPPVYDWSGFYVGGHLGYAVVNTPLLPVGGNDGVFGGIQGGYRWQLPNNVVLGLQLAVPLGMSNQTFQAFAGPLGVNTITFKGAFEVQGHLGLNLGRWMPFVMLGIGGARISAQEGVAPVVTNTHTLYSAGFGVNYAITNNWTTGVRAIFTTTSSEPYNCGPVACAVVGSFYANTVQAVGVLEYRFKPTM